MMRNQIESGDVDRRGFLKTGAIGAAIVAVGRAEPAAGAAAWEGSGTELVDARGAGVVGDGRTDDTAALGEAIARAKGAGASGMFLPAGVYLLSDAIYLPSDFRLVGAGRDATVLKAVPGTLFPMYRPDPRTVDIRRRRTMLTTDAVGSVREKIVRNVTVERLTLDWSNCPTEGYGHSVALIDSADHVALREVAVINAMPSDHPPTAAEVGAGGSNFRCECIMFSNARHGLMERCYLTDSGYRPLSVSYGSRDIVFRNGVIHAEKPVWRHCFSENHGDGLPRDETFLHAQVIFLNSTFILEGGTPTDGICSHTGTTHVENCDFHIRRAPTSFHSILRAFDGSRNCTYINNRYHCDGEHPAQFSVMATTRRTSPARGPDQDIVFERNLVDVSFGDAQNERRRAVVHFEDGDRRVRVAGNIIHVRWAGAPASPAIRLAETGAFSVAGNIIEMEAESGEDRPDGIVLENCRGGQVIGNVIAGRVRDAVRTEGESGGLLIEHNATALPPD